MNNRTDHLDDTESATPATRSIPVPSRWSLRLVPRVPRAADGDSAETPAPRNPSEK